MRRGNIFPVDSRIKQALHGEEQLFFIANAKKIQRLAERSLASFFAMKLASGMAVPGKIMAKSVRLSSYLFPVVGTCTVAITAAAAFGAVSAQIADNQPLPTPPALVQEADVSTEGGIIFSGGDLMFEHVNPQDATVWARNSSGALTAYAWWITDMDGETVLHGSGGSVEDVFSQLRESGRAGQYVLHFSMEDDLGGLYTLSRRFRLGTEP